VIQQAEAAHVHEPWFEAQQEYYSEPVRQRLERGRSVLATAYLAARSVRSRLRADAAEQLKDLHALLAPTTPLTAPLLGDEEVQVQGARHSLRAALLSCVVPTTQLGGPILSVPVGTHRGLPYGMQIIGRPRDEHLVLRIGMVCETTIAPR
jgi:aspartyl-tRNA(Asn)/glutamyl-tRNA(Gln) amidotransferase subunit A